VSAATERARGADFAARGYAQVRDEATVLISEEVLSLAAALPMSSWTQVVRVRGVTDDYALFARDERLDDLHEEARREAEAGLFSYSFARIADSAENRALEPWSRLRKMLDSPAVTDLISAHTGERDLRSALMYVNCFRHGDFLTTHSDKSGSRVVACFSLTRDWDPREGGSTHILAADRRTVVDTVEPALGCLLLLDLHGREVPHYVSEVVRPPALVEDFTRMTLIAQYA
jgi:hypothetical protein